MRYNAVRGLCFLFVAAPLLAQDPQLEMLRSTLATLRSHAGELPVITRGARPELTLAKHQLRDWIESRLATLGQQFDEKALAIQINRTLKAVEMPPLSECVRRFQPDRYSARRGFELPLRGIGRGYRRRDTLRLRLNQPTRTNGRTAGGNDSGRPSRTTMRPSKHTGRKASRQFPFGLPLGIRRA